MLDPILATSREYSRARARLRECMAARYADLAERIGRAGAPIGAVRLFDRIRRWADGGPFDPYFSSTVRVWADALDQACSWVASGTSPAYFERFVPDDAFDADLRAEHQELDSLPRDGRCARVGRTTRLVTADAVVESPRLRSHIHECLPDYPLGDMYANWTADRFRRHAVHVGQSMDLLEELGDGVLERVEENIHTLFAGLHVTSQCSLGSRFDRPGTILVGLSEERIARSDAAFTASQMYHEHCHTKLSLLIEPVRPALPKDFVLLSPFKNEMRDIESILHTVYPIVMEIETRLILHRSDPPPRALAYVAALRYRLEWIVPMLEEVTGEIGEPAAAVLAAARRALASVDQALEACPPAERAAHEAEKRRVLARRIWDIGQFLTRGVDINERGLQPRKVTPAKAEFEYLGERHVVSKERGLNSEGGYGRYIDAVLGS